MMPVKVDLAICSSLIQVVCLDSARVLVWLSCQAIIGISVLAGLFWVFPNPVTYAGVYIYYVQHHQQAKL